ncbi:MAG: preprotein translocase subunit YajC [Deltaproteobacteria bacterium]|nr:preprotein translocase subunit YajC [Deltaproteobacteria bacterium]
MYLALLDLLFWLQASGTAPSSAVASGDASAAAPAGEPGMSCAMQGGFMAVFFVIMYFLMIRPENKRREEQENLLKSLRPGQKVRTSSGILGEIVTIDANEAVLAIGQKEKIRINVLRSHIAGLEVAPAPVKPEGDKAKAADEKKADDKADKNDKKAEEKPAEKS